MVASCDTVSGCGPDTCRTRPRSVVSVEARATTEATSRTSTNRCAASPRPMMAGRPESPADIVRIIAQVCAKAAQRTIVHGTPDSRILCSAANLVRPSGRGESAAAPTTDIRTTLDATSVAAAVTASTTETVDGLETVALSALDPVRRDDDAGHALCGGGDRGEIADITVDNLQTGVLRRQSRRRVRCEHAHVMTRYEVFDNQLTQSPASTDDEDHRGASDPIARTAASALSPSWRTGAR